MTQTELIKKIAKETGITQKQAKEAYDSLISGLKESLSNDGSISLMNFGSFRLVDVPERYCYLPLENQTKKVPARKSVRFRASRNLKKEFN